MNGRYTLPARPHDGEAFDDTGAYLGNTDEPETKIGANATLRTGWDGSQVFQGAVDVFSILEDLSAALNADDHVAIRDTLNGLDGGLEQVISWRSEIGFGQAAANDARDIATHMEMILNQRKTEAVEGDPAVAFTLSRPPCLL